MGKVVQYKGKCHREWISFFKSNWPFLVHFAMHTDTSTLTAVILFLFLTIYDRGIVFIVIIKLFISWTCAMLALYFNVNRNCTGSIPMMKYKMIGFIFDLIYVFNFFKY